MSDKEEPPLPALRKSDLQAASISITEEHGPVEKAGQPTERSKRTYSIGTPDIVAVGVVLMALGAMLVAIIIALGFVYGKVPSREAAQIILGCIGGSAVSGLAVLIAKIAKDT